jgi:hypothetical protein
MGKTFLVKLLQELHTGMSLGAGIVVEKDHFLFDHGVSSEWLPSDATVVQ